MYFFYYLKTISYAPYISLYCGTLLQRLIIQHFCNNLPIICLNSGYTLPIRAIHF